MKKLILEQEQELAQFELEIETKKIELEFEKKKKECELKFQIQIAVKDAQLLEDDRNDSSSQRSLGGKSGFEFLPTMSDEKKNRLRNGERAVLMRIKSPNTTLSRAGKKSHWGRGARRLRTKLKGTSPLLRVTRLQLSC